MKDTLMSLYLVVDFHRAGTMLPFGMCSLELIVYVAFKSTPLMEELIFNEIVKA